MDLPRAVYELKGLDIAYMYVCLTLHVHVELCLAAGYAVQSKHSCPFVYGSLLSSTQQSLLKYQLS